MTVKKTMCAALSFIIILVMAAMPVSAIQVDDVHVHNGCCEGQEEDVSIQPKYVVSCPGGSKHAMYIKGQAYVYKGTAGNQGDLLISRGVTYQCRYCRLIVASQYNVSGHNPPYMLGYYAIFTNWPPCTGVAQFFYSGGNYSYNNGGLTTDPYWQGFDWYWTG